MAVIITNMEMPSNCGDCKLGSICQKGYGYQKSSDCPLKSADDMEAEIWEYDKPLVINGKYYIRISDAAEIINKYCKEDKQGG